MHLLHDQLGLFNFLQRLTDQIIYGCSIYSGVRKRVFVCCQKGGSLCVDSAFDFHLDPLLMSVERPFPHAWFADDSRRPSKSSRGFRGMFGLIGLCYC